LLVEVVVVVMLVAGGGGAGGYRNSYLLKHQVVVEVVKVLYLFLLEQFIQLQLVVVVQFQVLDKEEMMELLVQYQEVV
jgi:hypothetical protein